MPTFPSLLSRAPSLVLGLLAVALPLAAQVRPPAIDLDTVQVGRFDFGKMWTFEYAPAEYFRDTYGVDATPAWFERARMAALRIPGCSASFVSPNGLVVTNHHCAREAISGVTRPGESLLDDGFYATALDQERPIPDYWADQLIEARDVTAEVDAAVAAAPAADRSAARDRALEGVKARLEQEFAGTPGLRVDLVPLYNGGRYSAYVFRRFTDIRLVAAAELNLGFFGGDPDNFTYPRYALDFTFYRIYDDDGQPFRTPHWFAWGEGVQEGDPVFVIGNPGPTNRLQTVSQLLYQRDVLVPVRKRFFEGRLQALRDAYAEDPATGERLGLRNQAFSLSNSLKAYTGRLAALQDPGIMARKAAAERALAREIRNDPSLEQEFGSLLPDLAAIQDDKRELADESGAFYLLGHPTFGSRTLARALLAVQMGSDPTRDAALRQRLTAIGDHPGGLEEEMLRLRMDDLQTYLGQDHPLVEVALGGRSPEGAATALLTGSVLARQADARAALEADGVPASDPVLALARALLPAAAEADARTRALSEREAELAALLGRARFAVYGTSVPPDASSSPRITDGVVQGYEYNGTVAPPFTTMFGIYDRFHAHDGSLEWQLPERWRTVPRGLDLSTPLNFVSTADTYGGNSGSPAVTPDLAIVGLNFDRNIEGLSRDFIYLPDRGRNIMVDVRAIRESLDVVYDADRIVLEVLTGEMVATEAEADARRR